ncbi:unnamed protein product [Linum trigynum]|uniref:Uncharacterized protein n=1 Tax=Linum trigynum TaxID=586398 RepID=A0AAV2ECA4_9ROSI
MFGTYDYQESIADVSVVDLSHTVSEMMRRIEEGNGEVEGLSAIMVMNVLVERALVPKKWKMERLLQKADDQRLTRLGQSLTTF